MTTETKVSGKRVLNMGELSIIEEKQTNVGNTEQKPESSVENKKVEPETTQEPLQEASNHRNQRSEHEG